MDTKLQICLIQHFWLLKCSWVCIIYVYLFQSKADVHFLDLFTSPQPRYKLESDPMCGITTGGREECFWKCEVKSSGPELAEGLFKGFLLTPPDCLLGCFTKV